MTVVNTVFVLIVTSVSWICSQEVSNVNQTLETFEGCDIELIPPQFNTSSEWVTWAKGTTENDIVVYHVAGKRMFVSLDQCDLQGEYHVKDSTLGLSISNLNDVDSDVFFFKYGDKQYSFGLHVTELNNTILNEKLEVTYGNSVLTSPATITVALNSDVTLTAVTSEVRDAETPVITLTSDVPGQMGDNATTEGVNITGHSIQFKPNTSQAQVVTYTFVTRLCAVYSDPFDVTVVVLDIMESNDLCDFITVSREKVTVGWPFDMETISVERKSVSGEGNHQVIPHVAVTTENGRLLNECSDDQTCSFSVKSDDLEYNEENNIIITASVAGFEGECTKATVFDYTGFSRRGIAIVSGSAAALLLLIIVIIILILCCCCCNKRRKKKSETHF